MAATAARKVTIHTLGRMKQRGERIAMLTAYDYPTAKLLDQAGIDALLVGDSLGMVVLGHPTTLPVTMEDMIHHCQAVARGASRALLVGDLPFMAYQASREEAVRNAGRLVKEGHMEAVKLEGGREMAEAVSAIVAAGVPVMGHLGLTPQAVHRMGGYRIQGRDAAAADRMREDAQILEKAGAFSLVLEGVPAELAQEVTAAVSIPTIGIGAGPHCDGQVLVTQDMLGLFEDLRPSFVKRYAVLAPLLRDAFSRYRDEVRAGAFPGPEHSFTRSGPDPGPA
jgi:3-methyl-2-oxobutanoate hydroxymethyltransferase